MSRPHLLLVDDSEAILAFETVALSRFYTLSTARDGREAFAKIEQLRPAAVLLDLSMPEMDGDEVVRLVAARPELRVIPIVIISSERQRAEECLRMGAVAYLPKPVRADELLETVGRVLEGARRAERRESLAVLRFTVGTIHLGVPLDCVETVVYLPLTAPLPAGPSYLAEYFDLHGEPVCVLDLARRLAVEHSVPLVERKLIVVRHDRRLRLALCADSVADPDEFLPHDVVPREEGDAAAPLGDLLAAFVRTPRGNVPIIHPRGLLSRGILRQLPDLLAAAAGGQARAAAE